MNNKLFSKLLNNIIRQSLRLLVEMINMKKVVLASFIYGKLNPLLKKEGESIDVASLTLKDVVEDFYSLEGDLVHI